ncbi:cysteine-rich receptor-like protein kinase 26 isoform X5 [Juglans regia]|uniref:non-specific serine/threonine protein kinase n=1 Tax=Juglans regia TaxID=51240 RepID=A0A6P9E9U6_JUGRE|nr:cysteine-rich receptor-like protein kinase 26 isoform X5 [Juglans regia]
MPILVSSSLVLLFVAAIFRIISQAVAQPAFLYHSCLDDDRDNFISNSTYKANLNHLLHSISNSTEIINNGFYNSSYGQNINEVRAIGLCRGDVPLDICRGCLYNASYLLPELCPDHKEAIGWYDHCMLRYSNRSILGVIETSPNFTMWGINNVSANYVDQFFDVARSLLERLRSQAAASYSLRKFAAGNATVSNFKTIYALVQCTPDLSEQECNDCLLGASEGIPRCCDGKEGGRIARPSCDIRFEVYPFYYSTTNSPPPTQSPIPTDGLRSQEGTLNFIVDLASITFLGLILSITGIYIRAKRGRKKVENPLKLATLDWEMRYKIIRGIAQGVLYLHEESKLCFNHGLKASNIFVDEEMNPKISDFGLKSLLSLDQIPENTSRIGRIEEAPDVMHMLFSMKSIVFNFGVLVLEIVSGQKNSCFRDEENADNLLSYARRNFSEGTASNIIDPTILMPDGSTSVIINCIRTALLCAEANEADRPTMASVVTMLDGTDKHGSMETKMPSFEDDHRVLGRRTFLQRVQRLFWMKKAGFCVVPSWVDNADLSHHI